MIGCIRPFLVVRIILTRSWIVGGGKFVCDLQPRCYKCVLALEVKELLCGERFAQVVEQ